MLDLPEPRSKISLAAAISLFFAAFAVYINLYDVQPLLPLFREIFKAGEGAVSLIIGLAVLGIAAASIIIGPISDRFGRKSLMVASTFLLSLPTVGAALAHAMGWFLVFRVCTGLVIPGVIAVVIAYINEEYRPPASHSLMGLYVGSAVAGGLVGRLATGVLAAFWGWRIALWIIAGVTLLIGMELWRYLPQSRRFRSNPTWGKAFSNLVASFRHPALLSLGFLGFCYFFSFVSSFTYMTYYLADPPFRLSPLAIGLVFMVYIFGIVVSPITGRVADRIGPFRIIGIGLALLMAGMLITLVPRLWVVLIGLSVTTLGQFMAQAVTPGLVGQIAPFGRGAAGGMYTVFYYLGGSLGAAIPGLLWPIYHFTGVIAVNEVFLVGAIFVWNWARHNITDLS